MINNDTRLLIRVTTLYDKNRLSHLSQQEIAHHLGIARIEIKRSSPYSKELELALKVTFQSMAKAPCIRSPKPSATNWLPVPAFVDRLAIPTLKDVVQRKEIEHAQLRN